jgi:glycosyltransferase involved in cell wall biosynthesis
MTTLDSPLVSIVTPVYNCREYIRQNVRSVATQEYDMIEHIVVDGGSSDGTVQFLDEHQNRFGYVWSSEDDDGMYDAIETGFEAASGDIFAWLNADDMYFPWTIETVVEWLSTDSVDWVSGVPAHLDEVGRMTNVATINPRYRQQWIQNGWYHDNGLGFIQQESTFWTADLWESAGGFRDDVDLAGDFYLWQSFATETSLVSVPTVLAGFRHHDGQQTTNMARYRAEVATYENRIPELLGMLRVNQIYSLYKHFTDRIKQPAEATNP